MIALALGLLVLLLFLGALHAFANASVSTVRSLFVWVAALAGLSLALLLVLSGRLPVGLFALSLAFPLIRDWWSARRPQGSKTEPPRARSAGPMSVEEAWQVLGLRPGATEEEIRAAHHRLMRAAHPDSGGSDWLAARVNQARDVLLGKGGRGRV
jgi:DnaJ homolog subfamily C member 19